jgi:hypothetical protein
LRADLLKTIERTIVPRNAAALAGVGFLSGIGKLYEPWAGASKVTSVSKHSNGTPDKGGDCPVSDARRAPAPIAPATDQ